MSTCTNHVTPYHFRKVKCQSWSCYRDVFGLVCRPSCKWVGPFCRWLILQSPFALSCGSGFHEVIWKFCTCLSWVPGRWCGGAHSRDLLCCDSGACSGSCYWRSCSCWSFLSLRIYRVGVSHHCFAGIWIYCCVQALSEMGLSSTSVGAFHLDAAFGWMGLSFCFSASAKKQNFGW